MLFSKEKITSFKKITLTLKGMRAVDEYELVCNGSDTTVTQYILFYTRDKQRELNKSAAEPTEEIIKLLNDCDMLKWNGFSGANPVGFRDGCMFELNAEVNKGVIIRAHGSNNYPRHFPEFINAVDNILNKN